MNYECTFEVGTDWVDLTVFDGGHEFIKDDTAIMRLVGDLKSSI